MSQGPELDLARTFGEIARTLLAEHDAQATLDRVVRLAVTTIDNCEHAGVSRIVGRTITSPAASDDVPALVDQLQSETGEGPCLDAIRQHGVFYTGRLSQERRWPDFVRRAGRESRIESILSFRLFADADTMGSLNLYSTRADAFDDRDTAVGAVFATHAAVAWSTSRTIENLRNGMNTRQMIGEATGILMARQEITETQAFEMLIRASQRLNIKLRLVAEQIVRPDPGAPPEM